MKVLVTGCAGFIGARVTEFLLDDGHEVIGVDSLNTAYDPRLKEWRLDRLREREFESRPINLGDRQALADLFAKEGFSAVINLAARAGVRPSVMDPGIYYETNVTGTLNLLELCRAGGVGKFVLASTSSLYGDAERPFTEETPTDRPRSPHAASKKAAELLCYTYHQLHGLDVTIPRYFTVYGPAGRPDMSIFRFIRWIAEGEPLTLYGDGRQERDFTYVDDVARATVAALRPAGFEIVNVGSDHPVPLASVIALIEGLVGRKANIERHPADPSDVSATWAVIEKAKRLLGWEPQVSLEDGLQRTVTWYMDNRELASVLNLG